MKPSQHRRRTHPWPWFWLAVLLILPAKAVATVPPDFTSTMVADQATVLRTRQALQQITDHLTTTPEQFAASASSANQLSNRSQRLASWQIWQAFLDRMLVLEQLGQRYADVKSQHRQAAPLFLIRYGAFLAQYRYAMAFIHQMEQNPDMHTTLNERVPELGLPAQRYSALKYRYLNVLTGLDFAQLDLRYQRYRATDAVDEALKLAIEEDRRAIWRQGAGNGPKATVKNGVKILHNSGSDLLFPVQKNIAEWMGDTKIFRPQRSLISPSQAAQMATLLQPGDILLERREWYLSNIGLPGYWPHAALYIGTPQQRRDFFNTSSVINNYGDFEGYLQQHYPTAYGHAVQRADDGHLPRVVEAISEGVSFTTLEHSVSADSVAILRPRLPKLALAQALERAFHYSGRPYDFNFDFVTDGELVCTELVYKAYQPQAGAAGLTFPLRQVVGRSVTTANDIAKMFADEHATADQQLELIAFYDGHEWEEHAVRSDLATFLTSWQRSKWYIWTQKNPPPQRDKEI